MLSDEPVHAGIDNSAVVGGANRAIDHIKKRAKVVLKTASGALRLGGRLSPLHRESLWFNPFSYLNNGDLWKLFYHMFQIKAVEAVQVGKVKGHATDEAVAKGRVKTTTKRGTMRQAKVLMKARERHRRH